MILGQTNIHGTMSCSEKKNK